MDQPKKDESLMHDFGNGQKATAMFSPRLFILFLVVALLGVGTGYLLAKTGGAGGLRGGDGTKSGSVSKGKVFGSDDLKTYKDVAEGVMKEGGIEGEGAFHLERPGGVSQNVYLTSSTIDLSKFINKKVKVWGQTQDAEKAGWLMDVGRLGVL